MTKLSSCKFQRTQRGLPCKFHELPNDTGEEALEGRAILIRVSNHYASASVKHCIILLIP